jgi:hypothetical protein
MTELEYWAQEYPELDIEEIREILAIIDEGEEEPIVTAL